MSLAFVLALALTAVSQGDRPPGHVTIDVVVNDAQGRSVPTLQATDFSVDEQGTPQPVLSVRFVRTLSGAGLVESVPAVETAEDERREAGTPGARLFAIFLDEFHISPGAEADQVREALAVFVKEALSPRDLLVVLKPLDSILTIRLTRDREAALRAIDGFRGRKGDFTARTSFEQKFIAATPDRVEAARAQIASAALLALSSHLGSLGPMRKTLIVLTEGFECGARRRGDSFLPTLDVVVGAANRARVSIYPIDPTGLSSGPGVPVDQRVGVDRVAATRCQSLGSLASETSGQALSTTSRLGFGLQQILSDSSGYYELTLGPPLQVGDGRFHALRVRTANAGLAVRARKAYWAPGPERERTENSISTLLETSSRTALPRRISPMIRPWFGMAPAENGATRVSFVWEPAPRVPGEPNVTPRPARIALKVTKSDGTEVFDGIVLPTGGYGDDAMPGRSRAVFELPPGRLRVRMSIEDLASKVVDTDVRELVVRGFPGPLAFGTPEVLRARTGREYRELAGNLDAAPTAARQFSRRERLLIRVRVHHPDLPATVKAKLVSGVGGAMRDLPLGVTTDASVHQIDLSLAGLAPGAYSIELDASSPKNQVKDILSFTVTP